jgi:hypothetical protein
VGHSSDGYTKVVVKNKGGVSDGYSGGFKLYYEGIFVDL